MCIDRQEGTDHLTADGSHSPSLQYAGGNVTAWRWVIFVGLLVPSYWVGEGVAQLIEAVIEWNFFENRRVLYYFIGTTVRLRQFHPRDSHLYLSLLTASASLSGRLLPLGLMDATHNQQCAQQATSCSGNPFRPLCQQPAALEEPAGPLARTAGWDGFFWHQFAIQKGPEDTSEHSLAAAAAGAHVQGGLPAGAVADHLSGPGPRQPHLDGDL